MQKSSVTGMSCGACAARIENAVSKLEGVESCAVNLLENKMSVEGSCSDQQVIDAVVSAGYGACVIGAEKSKSGKPVVESEERESRILLKRFCSSAAILLVLVYFSMGYSMWDFPLPAFFDGNVVAVVLVQFILSSIILILNKKFFVSGFKALLHKCQKNLIISLFLVYGLSPDSPFHQVVCCSGIPNPILSCYSTLLFPSIRIYSTIRIVSS